MCPQSENRFYRPIRLGSLIHLGAALLSALVASAATAQEPEPSVETQGVTESGLTDDGALPPPPASDRDTDIAPLNLCALAPKQGTGAYQRQRVVMLDLAEDPSMRGAPEVELVKQGDKTIEVPRSVLRTGEPFAHAREVLLSVFPMRRHYLVLAPQTPSAVFEGKQPIALADAQALLGGDPHVAYSLGCADWLAAPYLTRGKVVWSKRTREKTVVDKNGKSRTVSYQAWSVSVPLAARLEVYRRAGDRFVHHATLRATPEGTAADDSPDWSNLARVYETLSVGMPSGCMTAGAVPPAGADAFQSCGGRLLALSPEGVEPDLGGHVRGRRYCHDLDDAVRADGSNMAALARCELRVAAEYTAVDLQLEGKQMCGWRLYSPLLAIEGSKERGVVMGAHEGAERGSYYIAYDMKGDNCGDDGAEAGWARIYRLGPGGEAGFRDPSEVHFQAGDPPSGVRMEEYALHGLRFAVRPAIALLHAKGDLDSTVAGGSLLEAAYDLTRFVPVLDEVWLNAHAGLLFGSETFLPIDLGVEGASYVGDRLSLIGGLGFAFTAVSMSFDRGAAAPGGSDVSLSGSVFGAQARAGVNYAIRPDWHARVMAEVRSGFGSATLKSEELPGVEVDGGPLLMSLVSLSLSYTY